MIITTRQLRQGRSRKEMDKETCNAIVSLQLFMKYI